MKISVPRPRAVILSLQAKDPRLHFHVFGWNALHVRLLLRFGLGLLFFLSFPQGICS